MKELQEMRVYRPDMAFWSWQWEVVVIEDGAESKTYYSKEKYDDPAVAAKVMLVVGAVVV